MVKMSQPGRTLDPCGCERLAAAQFEEATNRDAENTGVVSKKLLPGIETAALSSDPQVTPTQTPKRRQNDGPTA